MLDGSFKFGHTLEDTASDAIAVMRPKKRSTWLSHDADVG